MTSRPRLPAERIRQLEEALARLEALTDPRLPSDPERTERHLSAYSSSPRLDDGVTVSPDLPARTFSPNSGSGYRDGARREIAPYVDTWIIPELRDMLDWARGETTR